MDTADTVTVLGAPGWAGQVVGTDVSATAQARVKVTAWIVAKPKPKYADSWGANTWQRSWIIRP